MKEHYTDGRRWSYISNAWIFESGWNDKEEIARLQHEIQQLRATPPAATDGFVRVPKEPTEEMYEAAHHALIKNWEHNGSAWTKSSACVAWYAMLAAAPQSGQQTCPKCHGRGWFIPDEKMGWIVDCSCGAAPSSPPSKAEGEA